MWAPSACATEFTEVNQFCFLNLSLFVLPICVIKASDSHLLPFGACLWLQFAREALKKNNKRPWIETECRKLHCKLKLRDKTRLLMTMAMNGLLPFAFSALWEENVFLFFRIKSKILNNNMRDSWLTVCLNKPTLMLKHQVGGRNKNRLKWVGEDGCCWCQTGKLAFLCKTVPRLRWECSPKGEGNVLFCCQWGQRSKCLESAERPHWLKQPMEQWTCHPWADGEGRGQAKVIYYCYNNHVYVYYNGLKAERSQRVMEPLCHSVSMGTAQKRFFSVKQPH